MDSRFAALLLPLTLVACSPKGDGTDSGTDSGMNSSSTDASGTGTSTDSSSTDTSITGTSITGTSITGTSTDNGTDSSSSGGEELPAPDEVCPAFCDKFKSCEEPGMFDVAECIVDCEGTISFLDMNNPGAGCGDAYISVTECLSESTCEQIDAYYEFEDPMRPCMDWDDTLNNCAIE